MDDVVIVGAGPVGLFLAGDLGLAGCSVVVLEREPEPGSPWRADPIGMRGLSTASVEAFYRRGMLHSLATASGADEDLGGDPRSAGHFGGMVLDPADIDLAALPFRLPTPAAQGMLTSLEAVESVLAERAVKVGVEIRRGVTVDDLAQDEEGVVVRAGSASTRRAGSSAATAGAARCASSRASTSSAPSRSSPGTSCSQRSPIRRS